jgi:hypothetical protein
MDRFAIRHTRLGEVHMHVETAAQSIRQHFQMQFSLGGNDRLVQFGIHPVKEGRILLVQRSEPGRDFVLLARSVRLQRGVNGRFGPFDSRQRHRAAR